MNKNDKTPFIHTFVAPTGYYCFDVNTDCVIKIDQETFNILNEIKMGHIVPENENIIGMKKDGFLSTNRPVKICHPLTNFCDIYLNDYLNNLVLQVTQNCNLKCRYCPYSGSGVMNRTHNKNKMTWEVAKKAIDFLAQKSIKSNIIKISFYGGEPMLEFPLIKKCVDYANKLFINKKIQYSITTNGTVINPEIINFFADNNFYITLSFDGIKDVHDRNRRFAVNGKGTFDVIYKNLELIKNTNKCLYESIEINAVFEQHLDNSDSKTFFSKDKLFAPLKVNINSVSDILTDEIYNNTSDYTYNYETAKTMRILDNIFGFKQLKGYRTLQDLDIIKNEFSPQKMLPLSFHPKGPCIPGYKKLFVDINGTFLPCVNVSEVDNIFIIGNIYEGFHMEQVKKLLNVAKLLNTDCFNCYMLRHCSICATYLNNVDINSDETSKTVCHLKKKQFKEILLDYVVYKEVGII